jgi:glutaredoxin 3
MTTARLTLRTGLPARAKQAPGAGRTGGHWQLSAARATPPAHQASRPARRGPARPAASTGGDDNGISPAFPESLVNAITVALTNSPINEGKKWLARNQAGPYDSAAWRKKIDDEVKAARNGVIVYSWAGCPFCKKAKAILAETNAGVGVPIKVLELDEMGQEGKVYRAALSEITGRTSMPQVFIGQTFYGGCNDGPGVATLAAEGKLEPILRAAAAAA